MQSKPTFVIELELWPLLHKRSMGKEAYYVP